MGPGLAADCDAEGAASTVVLTHELWTSAFDADPAVVGREVLLNRQAFTVVGVAAEGVRGVDLEAVVFFAPISTQPLLNPAWDQYRGEWSWLTLIGRNSDESSLEQVRAELGVVAAQIDQQQAPRKTTLVVDRARSMSTPEDRGDLLAVAGVVMTAFCLVLLIACANVANLLLARATGRSREIAVRLSLGASRGRIVQQLLAESVLLALLGGVLGSVLALWSVRGVVLFAMAALPADAPTLVIDTNPDVRVLAFAFVLTLASGVLFGLAPALQLSKPDVHTAMKGDALGAAPRSSGRLLGTLLGVQVAVCMVLMVGAGLLLRGLYATQTAEPGFEYRNVTVISYDPEGAGYDAARRATFERQLSERVAALPGVEAVAQAWATPLGTRRFGLAARLPGQDWMSIMANAVSPDYFSLVEIPIVRGRNFTAAELASGSDAIIVTEATARRFWPDRDPLGQVLTQTVGNPFGDDVETFDGRVVGVAKDAQIASVGEIPSSYVYLPAVPGGLLP
jgi:predicted permease